MGKIRYALMYCEHKASTRYLRIMDFKEGQQIIMTLDEIDEVDPKLQELLLEKKEGINAGKFDYKGK